MPFRGTSAADTEAWLAAFDVLIFFEGRVAFGIIFLGGLLPLARVIIVVTAQNTQAGHDIVMFDHSSHQVRIICRVVNKERTFA